MFSNEFRMPEHRGKNRMKHGAGNRCSDGNSAANQ
jgi:hypothetical protein